MLSQTARYLFRILGILAEQNGGWLQGKEIARRTTVPANYLSKLLHQLGRAGYVESRKGWGGGFRLKEATRTLSIGEVLDRMEGVPDLGECVFGLPACVEEEPCPLHEHWEAYRRRRRSMLENVTVGDLLFTRKRAT